MRNSVVLLFIVLVFIIALKWRFGGLLTYWWFGIFRPQDWMYMDVSSWRLPLIAAIVFVIPCTIQRIIPRINNSLAIIMILWCSFALLAHLINGCTNVTQDRAMFNLSILIYIVLLTTQLVDSRQKIFWFIALVAISLAFHSGKGGLHALISGNLNQYGAENLRGMFSGSNAYALLSSMLLFFMIFTAQYLNQPQLYKNFPQIFKRTGFQHGVKYIMLLLTLGTAYNVISLSSRGASLAMLCGILLWIVLQKNRGKILMILIPISIIGLSVIPLPEGYIDRLSSVFSEEEDRDNSAASRPHFWKTAMAMTKENPLGVGPGCYAAYYDQFDPTGGEFGFRRSVHSSHFQILSDTGYVGALLWALLFIISYIKLFKIRRSASEKMLSQPDTKFYFDLSNALICAQTVFILGGSFYEIAYNDITWLIWGLVIALGSHDINQNDTYVKSKKNNTPFAARI